MQLSDEIINAFVKTLPNGEKDKSNGYELYYGTVKVSNGKTSVILDGSSVETPLNYLTMGAENGDRVTCIINDHSLIVTGNLTHPSEGMTTKYIETMTVLAQEAAIGKLIATEGDFTKLTADSAFVKRLMSDQVGASILTADEAFVGSLQSQIVTADKIKALQAEIGYVDAETLEANYIDAATIRANYVDTKTLHSNYIDAATIRANYVDAETLKANYIDANTLKANYVDTKTLKANYMDAVTIKADYLQANMANLKIVEAAKASIADLLADMALIKNATISQGHITGALDSVTLNANYITAGSLSVDRLYINGPDGKPRLVEFDASGKPVATTIDASILTDRTVTADKIVANSITANEISTDFLTAFRADIMQTVTEHLEAIDAEIQNLISGDTTISSLTVKSNASVGGKLTVTGSTILNGAVTTHSSLTVGGPITAKSLTLSNPLPETSGGTGVKNFNDLFKVFRNRDYRLNYTHTNLINPTAQTQTKNGVTFTNNGDGTYTVNGTASAWTFVNLNYVNSNTLSVPVGTYKLTGTPSNSGNVSVQVMAPDKTIGTESGNGSMVTIPQGTTASWVRIFINKDAVCNNLLFKPMLTTDLNATYDDFVAYSGDGELNENVAEIYINKQNKTDNTLVTTAKTIVGAINELLGKFTDYFTKSEINTTLGNYYTKTESNKLLSAITNAKVNRSGDTMSGDLRFGSVAGVNAPFVRWLDNQHEVWAGITNSIGEWYLYDATRREAIIHARKNQQPVFNGIVAWENVTNKPDIVYGYSVGGSFWPVTVFGKFADSNNLLAGSGGGNLYWGGNAWSDERLKKNIDKTKVHGLEFINKINVVEYDFIDNKKYGGFHEIGFIAQELEKVIPDAVLEVPADDEDKKKYGTDTLLTINNSNMIPYLVKAIQELSGQVDTLTKRVEELERTI